LAEGEFAIDSQRLMDNPASEKGRILRDAASSLASRSACCSRGQIAIV
jgi:hypothetical protein